MSNFNNYAPKLKDYFNYFINEFNSSYLTHHGFPFLIEKFGQKRVFELNCFEEIFNSSPFVSEEDFIYFLPFYKNNLEVTNEEYELEENARFTYPSLPCKDFYDKEYIDYNEIIENLEDYILISHFSVQAHMDSIQRMLSFLEERRLPIASVKNEKERYDYNLYLKKQYEKIKIYEMGNFIFEQLNYKLNNKGQRNAISFTIHKNDVLNIINNNKNYLDIFNDFLLKNNLLKSIEDDNNYYVKQTNKGDNYLRFINPSMNKENSLVYKDWFIKNPKYKEFKYAAVEYYSFIVKMVEENPEIFGILNNINLNEVKKFSLKTIYFLNQQLKLDEAKNKVLKLK